MKINRRKFVKLAGWSLANGIFVPHLIRAQPSIQNASAGAFNSKKKASGGGSSAPTDSLVTLAFNNSLTDSSGNGNNGAMITGSATYTTDETGASTKAFLFNGSVGNRVVGLSSSSIANFTTSDFSIEVWIKYDQANFSSDPVIVSKGLFNQTGYYLQFIHGAGDSTKSRVDLTINNNSPNQNKHIKTADTAISVGTWYHVVAVRSGTTGKIYVNGSDATSSVDTLPNPTTDTHVFWVGDYSGAGKQWSGACAMVSVFSRALTGAEVSALYSRGSL